MNTSVSAEQTPPRLHTHDATERCRSCGQPLGHWGTDKLTGLLDRWGWEEAAPRVWAGVRQQHTTLALLFIDIDHFKSINDTAGHPAGDAVLRAVADVLRRATRDTDIVIGRYGGHGGDEFLVLLPGTELDDAIAFARTVKNDINSTVVPVRTRASTTTTITDITVSVGIAAARPGPGLETFEDLLLTADTALRKAKHLGRDQIRVELEP